MSDSDDPPRHKGFDGESSIELLDRVRNGDREAMDRLFARYLGPLSKWAHGRLPQWARTMSDTQDLVQDGIVRVLNHLSTFQPDRPGALHWYLRAAVLNRIRDELRKVNRRPPGVELDENLAGAVPSPYDIAAKDEDRAMFERALNDLRADDRELVIARLEWGLEYAEIAQALGKPSPDAARVAVRRAVVKLAEDMRRRRDGGT
jgi:RNA polymerase sigma-70 factor (ECF subfamily)